MSTNIYPDPVFTTELYEWVQNDTELYVPNECILPPWNKGLKTGREPYQTKTHMKTIGALGNKALWSNPEMRKNLSQKRIDQHANGNNPMQGKKQKRLCCLCCKKETSINNFARHIKK